VLTAASQALFASFVAYWLVKIVPYWGLALIATTTLFLVPLIYTSNQELIDHHIQQASDIVNAQTNQIRDVASKHTAHATEITKQYMGDYTTKAQQLLRGRSAEPEVAPKSGKQYQANDFPAAPKDNLKSEPIIKKEDEEPLIAA